MRQLKIYLAGPDVFDPAAAAIFDDLKAHCSHLGVDALSPADGVPADLSLAPDVRAQQIYEANIAMLRQADGVIANLRPFRGLEPDSGTVFEVGFAIAMQLPVVAYGVPAANYAERVNAGMRCERDAQGLLRDQPERMLVEEFGQRLNLMLSRSVHIAESAPDALRRVRHLINEQRRL